MQKMSEKEAIMYLKSIKDAMCDSLTQQQAKKAIDMAIKALEEILLYKQGGLVLIPADVYQRQCDELDAYKTIADEDVNVETRQILTDLAFDEEKIKDFKEVKALQKAVIALKEIQQYREIGTVEELKELKDNGAFSGIELANIAVSLAKLQKYQVIGTVEQCREAVERMKPKKPIEYEDKYYGCPKCGNVLMHKWEKYPTILKPKSKGLPCCLNCLQVIDWSE